MLPCWCVMEGRRPPGRALAADATLGGLLGCLLEASRLLQLFPDYVAVSRCLRISQAVRCLFGGKGSQCNPENTGESVLPAAVMLLGK